MVKTDVKQNCKRNSNEIHFLGFVNNTWAIFWISVLGLFLEMLLIRWVSTEIRIFAYLQNTVLVVCFLGLGVGCFTSHQPIFLHKSITAIFFLVLLFALPFSRKILSNISEMLSVLNDLVIWGDAISTNLWQTMLFVTTGLLLTYFILALLIDIFVPIGRILGRLMNNHPKTIWAYSVNIAGSLIGTWLFVVMSAYYCSPVVWFTVSCMIMVLFLDLSQKGWKKLIVLLAGIVVLAWFAGQQFDFLKVIWSPYQKLAINKVSDQRFDKYEITVNSSHYQRMIDLSEKSARLNKNAINHEMRGYSRYDIPLLLHPNPQTCLIVGAGSGNDAAGAIRQKVGEITAVDIDPAIISMGKRYHPERPYDNPSVKVVVDDARSFFARSKRYFDVISFGLLDSHTTVALTNARLDHYVYTVESIKQAKALLSKNGVMALSFYAQFPFIADRMAGVLREVFEEEPLAFVIPHSAFGNGGVMFISGDLETAKKQIAKNTHLSFLISKWRSQNPLELSYTTRITTDDWPYVYLKKPTIPVIYYLMCLLLLILIWRCRNQWQLIGLMQRWDRSYWHFFSLGAAFLLLEVQNISKASIVLGNTWKVNAIIVSGVLTMVLLANLLTHKYPRISIRLTYIGLVTTCCCLYFIDLSMFAFLNNSLKMIIISGLTTLPMLFSGIIFIRSFSLISEKDNALGANLVGAIVGAIFQSVTFIVGIKALLLIVLGMYGISYITQPFSNGNGRINGNVV